jgi:hypothetical protein
MRDEAMSSRVSRLLLIGLFSAAAVAFSCGRTAAQEKRDLLKDAQQRVQIEIQRVEAEFNEVKKQAKEVSRDNPARAIALLEALREKIAANADLPDAKRDQLLQSIKISIDAYKLRGEDLRSVPVPNPAATARAQEEKRKAEDADRLRQQLDKLDRLRRAGRADEAMILAAEIARDYPDNPAAQAERLRTGIARAQAADADLKAKRELAFLRVGQSIEESAIPQAEDIRFPDNWAEITKKRTKLNVTPEEAKVIKALSSPITIDMKESTLEAVIGYLKDKAGVDINVPKLILEEKNITYQTPVSVSLKDVTLRTVLKKVLADVSLTYIVKEGAIQVTTEERAKQTLTVRTYYIGDLLQFAPGVRISPYAQVIQAQAINDIIGLVVSSVEPQSWWINGGPGRIVFEPRSQSLIVSQTAEIHFMLGLGKQR